MYICQWEKNFDIHIDDLCNIINDYVEYNVYYIKNVTVKLQKNRWIILYFL